MGAGARGDRASVSAGARALWLAGCNGPIARARCWLLLDCWPSAGCRRAAARRGHQPCGCRSQPDPPTHPRRATRTRCRLPVPVGLCPWAGRGDPRMMQGGGSTHHPGQPLPRRTRAAAWPCWTSASVLCRPSRCGTAPGGFAVPAAARVFPVVRSEWHCCARQSGTDTHF